MLLTILAALVVLGVLIFVHELGHFLAAKAVGIGTPKFSIGFGPATPLKFKYGETEYVVSWIPLGGYVKMATKEEAESLESVEGVSDVYFPPDKLFENKSVAARIVVISAGVIMNALFAWGAYSFVAGVYGRQVDPTVTIAEVDDSVLPEAASGLSGIAFGTDIVRINGDTITSWNDVLESIAGTTGEGLFFEFSGGVEPVEVPIPGIDTEARVALFRALVRAPAALVGTVFPGTPAAAAGIQEGDLIVGANGDTIRGFQDLTEIIEVSAGEEVALLIDRRGTPESLTVVPALKREVDPETGVVREVGRIGIQRALETRRVGPVGALAEGWRRVVVDGANILGVLRGMFTGRLSPRELGGPIFVAQLSGQFARIGFDVFLSFMAFFSVNLAILNLLPIPVLDGGHLIFLIAEGVRGKPLPASVRLRLSQIGLTLLLGLMLLAVTNDVMRLFE